VTTAVLSLPVSLLPFRGSAGNVSALPDEIDLFLNDGTPQNNRPALSSIADRCRNSPHTSGNTLPPKAKKMASDLANSQKP